MIKLNAANLAVWLFFTTLLLLIAANYLTTLLEDETTSISDCLKLLIEASVGRVYFNPLKGMWSAHFSYMAFVLILFAVLMSMLIAKMNNTYT